MYKLNLSQCCFHVSGFVPSKRLCIMTILSVGLILPTGCLLCILVSSAIVATPLRRCEFTKSNVFSNSFTLFVIFLSLFSSLLRNCSCTAFCSSHNLSSSTPSKSSGFGRPSNINSNISISSTPIVSFHPVALALFVLFLVLTIGSPNSVSNLPLWDLSPLF